MFQVFGCLCVIDWFVNAFVHQNVHKNEKICIYRFIREFHLTIKYSFGKFAIWQTSLRKNQIVLINIGDNDMPHLNARPQREPVKKGRVFFISNFTEQQLHLFLISTTICTINVCVRRSWGNFLLLFLQVNSKATLLKPRNNFSLVQTLHRIFLFQIYSKTIGFNAFYFVSSP